MRYLVGFACVLALGVVPVVGCSSDGDAGGSGGSAGVGGIGGEGGGAPNRTAELEEFLDDYIDQQVKVDDTGIAVALVGPGGVVELERTYGMANLEESVALTSETVFELASVSKQFTATAIMMLYEEGLVAPEDPVSETFSEGPAEWASMTVHHLLTHQSGLPDYANDQPPGTVEGWSNADVLAYLLETSLEFPPGDEFEYSNSGYAMLAMLLERVTGESFADFLQQRIFEPLGMSDTLVPAVAPPDVPNLARGYRLGHLVEYSSRTNGAGHQHSTLEDLIQWELGIRDAALLSPDTLALMFTRHVDIPVEKRVSHFDDCDYGYGWMTCSAKVGPLLHHGGRTGGFRTLIDRDPAANVTVIMLSNGSYEWTFEIGDDLIEFYRKGSGAP